jgi:transcriptional regulator with XRE-family HTH domain
MEAKQIFSANFRRLLAFHGLNRNQLSRLTGLGKQRLGNYYHAKNLPYRHETEKLASFFSVTASYLLTNVTDELPEATLKAKGSISRQKRTLMSRAVEKKSTSEQSLDYKSLYQKQTLELEQVKSSLMQTQKMLLEAQLLINDLLKKTSS